jgi:spore germination protein YaaH
MNKFFKSPFVIWPVYTLIGIFALFSIYKSWQWLKIKGVSIPKINTPIPSPTKSPAADFKIRASIPYWDQARAFTSAKDNVDSLDSISLFWYHLNTAGEVVQYRDARLDRSIISWAKSNGIKTSIVITNLPEESDTSWDSERVERAISDSFFRQERVDQIAALAKENGVDGVTIDFEEVDAHLRDEFTIFISELSQRLHQDNLFVGVALHPKSGASSDRLYEFQDWQELSYSADELYIMSYGEHWDEGAPGAIASKPWVEKIISYALGLDLSLEKFYLGIPLYGYDWNLDDDEAAEGVEYVDVKSLMLRYGIESEWGGDTPAPYFRYSDTRGRQHDVWFENAASVEEKVDLARNSGFGGISFWRLGGEDPDIWSRVSDIKVQLRPTPALFATPSASLTVSPEATESVEVGL